MRQFFYTALTQEDGYVKGSIEARSLKAAAAALEAQQLTIVQVRQQQHDRFAQLRRFMSSISLLDKIFFTRNLYTMIEAGIALDQALKITAEQTENPRLKEACLDMFERVRRGQSLSSSLENHQNYFSEFFINLIRVGERGGTLHTVLAYLLEQQEQDYELRTKARSAMVYPIIILSALFAMVILMLIFVLPRVTGVLLEYSVELPFTTRTLIGASNFLTHWGWLFIPLLIIAIIAIVKGLHTKRGQRWWSRFVLRVPYFKLLVTEFNLARFFRSMSALVHSGMSIDQALSLSATVMGNLEYRANAESGVALVRRGAPFSDTLSARPDIYPLMASRMAAVGEKTGKLDHMLGRLATFYEKSVLTRLGTLASTIEPFLLVIVGASVAFVALSVLLPIWKFSETI